MAEDLAANLRHLCAEHPSVAAICRGIGINHQQFSKYLSGRTRPSPHNLRRISRFFDVPEALLLGPHSELQRHAGKMARTKSERRRDPLVDIFPGELPRLRPHLGAYQIFFRTPSDPERVIINAGFLDERNGQVLSRIVEPLRDTPSGRRRWTRCDGKACFQAGQIFVMDAERGTERALSQYILSPPYRDKAGFLFGAMSFLASLPARAPAFSPVVWKRFETYRSVRDLFETCGARALASAKIDPAVRRFLQADPPAARE